MNEYRLTRMAYMLVLLLAGVISSLMAQETPTRQPASELEGRPKVWLYKDQDGPCGDATPDRRLKTMHDLHSNEPSDFKPFALFDACLFAGRAPSLLGTWENDADHAGRNMALRSDPSAPASPPGVIVTRYPQGWTAGRGPVYWNGWDSAGSLAGQKRAVYLSLWMKLDGESFETAPVGTKLGFIGYGQNPRIGANQGFFILKGGAHATIRRVFQLGFFQQNHVARNLGQNANNGPGMTAGRWHHWEVVLRLNTIDRADGAFRMWVDDRLIMDHDDVVYVTAKQPNGFFMYTWNPTWGGYGATKTREDRILIDQVYLSGLPYEPSGRTGRAANQ